MNQMIKRKLVSMHIYMFIFPFQWDQLTLQQKRR